MAANGRLTDAELSPIFNAGGPSVKLAKTAAAAWNSMALLALRRDDLGTPQVNGPDSAYRTYERQQYWKNYWCNQGKCGNAATPGTSNHGWGLAVDVPSGTQQIIRSIGRQFGWDFACSDAKWEAWHSKWCGGYSRPDPGPDRQYPVLQKGSGGPGQDYFVKVVQTRLKKHGFNVDVDGGFGEQTAEALADFCRKAGITPKRKTTKQVWKRLRRDPDSLDPNKDREDK